MKFNEYEYKRPNIEQFRKKLENLTKDFSEANDVQTQIKIIEKINKEINHFETMATIISIRYSLNTTDEYIQKEQEFFDEVSPLCQASFINYYKALVNSKFKEELIQKLGKHLFDMAEQTLLTFKEELIEDLQEENKLCSEYSKLIASAKIKYKGKVYALTQMSPFAQSTDRKERKEVAKLTSKFFEENEAEFDRIYDCLVKVRTNMGKKMGYDSYLPLGYLRMGRMDYNPEDVAKYREQIEKDATPLATKLMKRQFKRTGIRNPKNYDLSLEFLDGNPTPKGNKDQLVAKALKMYQELSNETGEFFHFMIENDLMDLDSRQNKRGGGYCTFISDHKAPFIFANFNGTSHDVDVLTHEAGHAFQAYCNRNNKIPEYTWPTMEAAEIHSMSMEFFTWPWRESFFENEADKYRYSHLSGAVTFLPYGACVDHFQEWVYTNPEATPDERKAKWRELETRYTPWKKYDIKFLDKGTLWYRQSHIFTSPLYYIDYTLAQVCALQFWSLDQKNHSLAWKRYLKLCKMGGKYPFLELVKRSSLKNPFQEGTIKKTLAPVKKWLNNIDDTKL